MSFELHPRLDADCFFIEDLSFSRLLLMNDRRFAWCILVPRLEGLTELHDVPQRKRNLLFQEIETVSRALINATGAYKINVAALGNQVPQLHIHVIARHQDDAAWPAPVWSAGSSEPYPDETAQHEIAVITEALANL